MLRFFFLTLLVSIALHVAGQDVIRKTDGQSISCTVIGVTSKDVKYKKPGPENREVFSIGLDQVVEVKRAGEVIYPDPDRDKEKHAFFQDESPNFITFSLGGSMPIGLFAEQAGGGAGFATSGFSWQLEGAKFFKPFLGIGIKVGSFSNLTNETAWQAQLRDLNPGIDLILNSGGWTNSYVLIGPTYALVSDRVILDLDLTVGLVNTTDPKFDISFFEGPSFIQQASQQTVTSSFGFGVGTKVRFALTQTLGLRAGADYMIAQPQIVTPIVQTRDGMLDARGTLSYQQSIAVVNLNGGLVYHFSQ